MQPRLVCVKESPRFRRIVFLSPAAQGGGAEAVLLDLLAALRTAQPAWEFFLIAAEDGPLLDNARALGVHAEVLSLPPTVRALGETGAASRGRLLLSVWASLGWVCRLRHRLRVLRPDLVHSNGLKTHALGALALALPGARRVPLLWHLHDYLGSRATMAPILRALGKRCAAAVAISDSVAQDAREILPARVPIRTVRNAIDLDRFTPDGPRLDLDALAGLPAASGSSTNSPALLRIGLVATFAFWKGHGTFLRAAAHCLANGLRARFYIIGGPIYATTGSQHTREDLEELASGVLGADALKRGDLGFTGFVNDAPAALRALDIVVHASTRPEPFGLVIAQGMACGRAVVASAGGGACELFVPEREALAHPPGDAAALAAAITRLAEVPELRARLGKAGRSAAEQRFSRSRLAEELTTIYDEVLAAR
ncbi:MAG: glycosyltransferase family 4 protein [Verrucomicrobia bacterium]|nr:glycosyltransferase family 4 protein [Verrucomicrobiota bacterium]